MAYNEWLLLLHRRGGFGIGRISPRRLRIKRIHPRGFGINALNSEPSGANALNSEPSVSRTLKEPMSPKESVAKGSVSSLNIASSRTLARYGKIAGASFSSEPSIFAQRVRSLGP